MDRGLQMKVLIVEDDPGVGLLLDTLVRDSGHEPLRATDGEEGFRVFRAESPDLVLSDISMPRHDGLHLLEQVRSVDSEAVFVVMTGIGSEQLATRALELRANNYLRKPVELKVLRGLLDKYARLQERRRISEEVKRLAVEKEIRIELPNRLELIPEVVSLLLSEVAHLFRREELLDLQLGLYELIVNAVEHGNLGIGFEEKRSLLAVSPQEWTSSIERRAKEERYRTRKVRVGFRQEDGRCEWVIEDMGEGFDPEAVPACFGEGIEELSGRGIFLAQLQFDELEFLDKGNRVRAVKYTSPANPQA